MGELQKMKYDDDLYTHHWDACIAAGVEPFHSIPFLDGECEICSLCLLPIKNCTHDND